jgi:hypothetical protein
VTSVLLPLSGSASAAGSSPVRHSYDGLTVSFPAGWKVLNHSVSLTSESNTILYASNQAIHFKCVTTQVAGGSRTDCQGPLTRLRPNGALVQWDLMGQPGGNVSQVLGQGKSLTVDGLSAKVTITPGGTCYAAIHALGSNAFDQEQEAVGSQETIRAVVATRMPANYLTFNACMRGPDLKGLTRSLMASLRSTKVSQAS